MKEHPEITSTLEFKLFLPKVYWENVLASDTCPSRSAGIAKGGSVQETSVLLCSHLLGKRQ